MQNNPAAFQDAVARAREIAQKLSASAPNSMMNSSLKRSNNDDDYSNKRPAFSSPTQSGDISNPALRAQQIAQQINSQLGVRGSSSDHSSLPLSNQLTFQEDYKIPDKFVGLVIGKGGEQIIRLQADSGCKVQICPARQDANSSGSNPPDRVANLCGSRDAIERAKRIMDEIVSRGRTVDGGSNGVNPYSMGGTNSKSLDVMLPSAKCGLIIGKGGETIRRISDEFGVKMLVIQELTDIDGIEHKPLRITGDQDKIERARQYVLDTLSKPGPGAGNRFGGNSNSNTSVNDYGSRTGGGSSNGPCNEATYHVSYDKAGIIIGKGGESIKEINRKSGAFVELDKSHMPAIASSGDRLFKIRGTPDQIVLAQQLMFEKANNSPHGPGDLLTPIQFQQKFNLPLHGSGSSADPWAANNDPYGSTANSNDMYSQWANAYGQWPQTNSYDDGTGKNNNGSSNSGNPADMSAMGQMDPAWLAYYQSMSLYNMAQSSGAAAGSSANKPTEGAANASGTNATASATSAAAGQTDYSQQWIEYYRSMGQNDLADQISKQTKESGSSGPAAASTHGLNPAAMTMSSGDAWAAYAQQWANNAMSSNASNGTSSSAAPPS